MRHLTFLWFIQGAGSRSSFSYCFSLTMFSVTNSYQYNVVTYTVRGCTAHATIWCIWQVLLWNPVVSFPVWDQLVDSVTVSSAGSGLRRPLWKSHLYHWHCALRWKPTLGLCASGAVSFYSVFLGPLSFLLCEFSHLPAFSNKQQGQKHAGRSIRGIHTIICRWEAHGSAAVGVFDVGKRRKEIIVWNCTYCLN